MYWRFNNWRRRLLPGWIATLAIALLWGCGILQPIEQLAYQALFLMRGEQAWDPRVVVVKIDDRSLQQLGRFPWNRSQYVKLLNLLSQAESSVVAFDLIWSESSAEDPQLADAIATHGGVVLAFIRDALRLPLEPVEAFQPVQSALGHIHKEVDSDGVPRKVPAFVGLGKEAIPAFAIATLATDNLMREGPVLPDSNQLLWVNWLRSSKRIPSYSFVDVVRNRVPISTFDNKIILVGVTATTLDELITPFDRQPPTSGVYLHATLINNVLQGNLLKIPPLHWGFGLLILAGWSLSAWLVRLRTLSQIWVGFGFAIAWLCVCVLVLRLGSLWLTVATPILLVLILVATSILQERLSLNAVLQRQVKELWQRYYSDLVLRQVDESVLVTHQLMQQPVSMQRVKQLATLAEQFARSNAAQAAIARNLSLGLLAADLDGFIWFCNPIAAEWLNVQVGILLQSQLVPHWLDSLAWEQVQSCKGSPLEVQRIDRWFELKFEPLFYRSQDLSPSGLLLVLEDITERKQNALSLQTYADTQATLNQRLTERTTQLEVVNQELDAFSFAVSHDLRAPLRRIKSFSDLLLEETSAQLDETGKQYLNYIQLSVQRMGDLIEDLLKLSRMSQVEMYVESVNLSQMASAIAQELRQTQPDRALNLTIQPNLVIQGDARLLRVALENLLDNAWKFTSQRTVAEIEFGQRDAGVFFIRDNGVGFDPGQAKRLFGAFQRLHSQEEFPGVGVGLMTTRRIIHRHQGRIWAESAISAERNGEAPAQGTTFYFTLPTGLT